MTGGDTMEYENGKVYTFKVGECTANVILENFSPEVKENFNKILAEEKVKAYQKKVMQEAE